VKPRNRGCSISPANHDEAEKVRTFCAAMVRRIGTPYCSARTRLTPRVRSGTIVASATARELIIVITGKEHHHIHMTLVCPGFTTAGHIYVAANFPESGNVAGAFNGCGPGGSAYSLPSRPGLPAKSSAVESEETGSRRIISQVKEVSLRKEVTSKRSPAQPGRPPVLQALAPCNGRGVFRLAT